MWSGGRSRGLTEVKIVSMYCFVFTNDAVVKLLKAVKRAEITKEMKTAEKNK
jgi:hypothetical protein